jgi:ABC-2 type transport system ATP-binding protein
MKKIISLKNISIKFKGNDTYTLKNISFDIYEKQNLAIIGSNGVGKTSLLKTIMKFNKQTEGEIIYCDYLQKDFKYNIDAIFQDSVYPDGFKVKHIINFFLKIRGVSKKTNEFKKIYDFFDIKQLEKK